MQISTKEELDQRLNYPSYAQPLTAQYWHMIYSFETMRAIAVTQWIATVNSMAPYHINSYPWYTVNAERNIVNKLKVPKEYDTVNPWKWKYDLAEQQFKLDESDLSFNQIYYLSLGREKAGALDIVHRRINSVRRALVNDLNAQHTIYRYKEEEAEALLAADEDAPDPNKYLFVSEYAELTGVDLKLAAREILLQADFVKSKLVDTETARIKYARAINHAEEIPEIRGAVSAFLQESMGYATT